VWNLDQDEIADLYAAPQVAKLSDVDHALRMTDLLSLQPNLGMPMFLVAPEDRREKVQEQLFRPTFARMRPRPGVHHSLRVAIRC
jgi:hypothetical protein